ncbi:hypothetical protein SAMN05421788_109153 [Filimonas lacunae]|uniref:Uncharacterized protein n=1 Tax=Filimonas lacunae TaxID=477680 RepID=A0A1N7R4X8_9BACT|nr:hypothetical protein SAMN05421788_109153 [Filimonas lacunae]
MLDHTEELYHIVKVTRNGDEDIAEHCNLSDKQLLALCGGIPDNTLTKLDLTITIEGPCTFETEVHTEKYYVSRNINLQEGIIINNTMLVPTIYRSTRIGTKLFYNQIVASRAHSFSTLRTNAIQGTDFYGYVTW